MSGGGSDNPPPPQWPTGGEFLLSLLRNPASADHQRPPHHHGDSNRYVPPSAQHHLFPSQAVPLDPAVAAVGPAIIPSGGRDRVSPPWPPRGVSPPSQQPPPHLICPHLFTAPPPGPEPNQQFVLPSGDFRGGDSGKKGFNEESRVFGSQGSSITDIGSSIPSGYRRQNAGDSLEWENQIFGNVQRMRSAVAEDNVNSRRSGLLNSHLESRKSCLQRCSSMDRDDVSFFPVQPSNMAIECLVLGAGQEVGKSCVVVTINGRRIMFDCGMHMGYLDRRRYPDFSKISSSGDFTVALDCIIITHFHLDHVGALPYFTEVCGYSGPIYMTYPTKALSPLMLEDYRRVMVERRGEEEQFTSEHIAACMKKVVPVDLNQTVQIGSDLFIRAYYAGHVLGAAMFHAKVGDAAVVYTGDYNMTPDRHLGAAQIDRLQLDLLITESTYATTVRDSRYTREREFLTAVHKCVEGGGKVLIPTFALGRAQELCMLLDDYWERMNLKVPVYFSAGLTIQANMYYKMLINWTSQKVKESYATRNPFDFKNVRNFDRSMINDPGPCVLFATPGMISGGFSLEVFKSWAPSELNLVTLPGYCVAGTVGHKLMSGKPTRIDLDKDTQIDVRCQIHQLSFSPHTDAQGIMDLVKFLSPKHVVLVHGEKPKMATLKGKIESELGISCYYPANNEMVTLPSTHFIKASASDVFARSSLCPNLQFLGKKTDGNPWQFKDDRVSQGVCVMEGNEEARVIHQDELLSLLRQEAHDVKFAFCFPVRLSAENRWTGHPPGETPQCPSGKRSLVLNLLAGLSSSPVKEKIQVGEASLQVESVRASICAREQCPYRVGDSHSKTEPVYVCCEWTSKDSELAWDVISRMKSVALRLPCSDS